MPAFVKSFQTDAERKATTFNRIANYIKPATRQNISLGKELVQLRNMFLVLAIKNKYQIILRKLRRTQWDIPLRLINRCEWKHRILKYYITFIYIITV